MNGTDRVVGVPPRKVTGRKIVLIGMMGVGKSSAGRRVAEVLGLAFVDLDRRIERTSGRTIREIFETDGEPVFRDLEEQALREVLDEPQPMLIAAGGGIVVRSANRRLLEDADDVVWLRADAEVLARRVRAGRDHRPLVDGDPAERLRALAAERDEAYRHTATATIDVNDLSLDGVVTAVLDVLDGDRAGHRTGFDRGASA